MEPIASLPDLSVVPAGATKDNKEGAKYEEMTEMIEAAVPQEEVEKAMPTLCEKGEEYARKLKEGDKERKEEKEEHVKAPALPEQTAAAPPKPSVDEIIKKRRTTVKGRQKGSSAAARAALAMMDATSNAPPVKPLPQKEKGKEKQDKQGEKKEEEDKGKEKEKEAEKEPLSPEDKTPTASFRQEEEESDGNSTEKEQSDEKLWEDARAGGSDEFPTLSAPGISEEYKEFSVASSHIEGLGADIQALSRQMTMILATVKEQSVKVASLQATVAKLEEDKSQFLSHTLDRIRQIERQMGNKPPIVASAAQIAAPIVDAGTAQTVTPGPASPVMSLEEKQKRLAALKAQKNW